MDARRIVPAPPAWLTLAENRAVFEFGAFLAASPILRMIGRGDRHPVLVLPGFTAGDRSTEPLRWFLRGQGYWVHGWSLGRNLGPTRAVVNGLDNRLAYVHSRHDRRVTLVGWSLGGIYARMLARKHPDLVRQVITLGTPFQLRMGDHSAAEPVWKLVEPNLEPGAIDHLYLPEPQKQPLSVPATSIYSKSDGVVRWYTCIDSPGDNRENIEVRGSHSGLGWNPAVLVAVADRLAQREGSWKPFSAPLGLTHLFPRPEQYRAA
jgi:pimeloyl-ACP methyl ester carboxylesterase